MSLFFSICMAAIGAGTPIKVDLPAAFIHNDSAIDPANATCGFQVLTAGTWSETGGSGGDSGTWLILGAAGDYEGMLTKTSGEDPGVGTLDVWEDLSVGGGQAFSWTQGSVGTKTFTGTYSIRQVSNNKVLASCSVSMACVVDA